MKMKKSTIVIIIIVLLLGAGAILIHQLVNWGMLFNPDDFLHHENFALLLVAFAGGLSVPVIVVFWRKNKGKTMKKTQGIALIAIIGASLTIGILLFANTTENDEIETQFVQIDENTELAFVNYDFYSGRDLIYMNLVYVASNPTAEIIWYNYPYNTWAGDLWLSDAQLLIWLNVSTLRCQNGTYHVFWGMLSNGQNSYGFIFHQNGIWRYIVPIAEANVGYVHDWLVINAE